MNFDSHLVHLIYHSLLVSLEPQYQHVPPQHYHFYLRAYHLQQQFQQRLSLFDDNIFVDKQELSLRKKIQSKQNELDLLIGK